MLNHNVCEVYLVMCLELFADRLSPAVVDIYPGTRNSRENGLGGELPYFILIIWNVEGQYQYISIFVTL